MLADTVNASGLSPTSATLTATPGINRTNERKAFDFFVSEGLSKMQAAGIVGNLDQEWGMDPRITQIGGGPCRGIAQWGSAGGGTPTPVTTSSTTLPPSGSRAAASPGSCGAGHDHGVTGRSRWTPSIVTSTRSSKKHTNPARGAASRRGCS